MKSFSDAWGWPPDVIKRQSALDLEAYSAILEGESERNNQTITKNNERKLLNGTA